LTSRCGTNGKKSAFYHEKILDKETLIFYYVVVGRIKMVRSKAETLKDASALAPKEI